MNFWATEFFKTAALMPNVSTRGLVLPPPRQKVLSNLMGAPAAPAAAPAAAGMKMPNIKPQFAAESSSTMMSPGISRPAAKVAEFNALAYFAMLG